MHYQRLQPKWLAIKRAGKARKIPGPNGRFPKVEKSIGTVVIKGLSNRQKKNYRFTYNINTYTYIIVEDYKASLKFKSNLDSMFQDIFSYRQ